MDNRFVFKMSILFCITFILIFIVVGVLYEDNASLIMGTIIAISAIILSANFSIDSNRNLNEVRILVEKSKLRGELIHKDVEKIRDRIIEPRRPKKSRNLYKKQSKMQKEDKNGKV